MTVVLAFKHKVHFISSCAAFSSQRAHKHFYRKNCVLTVCSMGHLKCHGRATHITPPPCWLTTSSTAATGVCLLQRMAVCVSKWTELCQHLGWVLKDPGHGQLCSQQKDLLSAALCKLCVRFLQLGNLLHAP